MAGKKTALYVLLALAVLVVVVVALKCNLHCKKDTYMRSDLGQALASSTKQFRSEVDYVQSPSQNPHWVNNPGSVRQPLTGGPLDFYADQRKLTNGKLWKQYDVMNVDGPQYFPQDAKSRADLVIQGNLPMMRYLLETSPDAASPYPIETRMHGAPLGTARCEGEDENGSFSGFVGADGRCNY